MHGPQAFARTIAPKSLKGLSMPSLAIVALICSEPGVTVKVVLQQIKNISHSKCTCTVSQHSTLLSVHDIGLVWQLRQLESCLHMNYWYNYQSELHVHVILKIKIIHQSYMYCIYIVHVHVHTCNTVCNVH